MPKKSGLGKGLDALFTTNPFEEEQEGDIVRNLKLIEVEPNREQARKVFDEQALSELAESIKNYGVIQPIVVAQKDDYYQIIAGERRWRAAKKAGLQEIPAIVRDDNAKKNQEISLIENIQREDLNPIEKARGIKTLMDDYNLTQANVAEILGKARSSVANSVRLLNLDERVIDLAIQGKLTEAHCKALLAADDRDKQYAMALKIIENGSNVAQTVKQMKTKKKINIEEERKYNAIYKDIENRFQGFFGTKVRLDAGKKKGKIIIEYTNNDDLERILDLIG